MATNNIVIKDSAGHNVVPSRRFRTEAGAAAILVGEPVKLKAAASGYVIPLADAEPVIGTTTSVVGITASAGTHTATADGYVDVYIPLPGVVYRAGVKTLVSSDTDVEILGKLNDRVVFDLTTGVYTVDNTAADGATNGLVIVDMLTAGTCDFMIRTSGTYLN